MAENNLLAGEWAGDWTVSGNGGSGTGLVQIEGLSAAPVVADSGLLTVQLPAGVEVRMMVGGGLYGSSGLGQIPNEPYTPYGAMVALRMTAAPTAAALDVYVGERNAAGQMKSVIGPSEDFTGSVAPGEVVQVSAAAEDGHDGFGSGDTGAARLTFTAAEDTTAELLPLWYGAAANMPEALEWPEEEAPPGDGGEGDPGEGSPDALDEWDALATQLAPRVARYVARRGDEEATELAADQLPMILSFVYGYTRGQGFSTEELPTRDLRAVIVSAAARALVNPEQLQQFSSGDYSETSPRLTGFTLMERRVLNNYRRVWA